MSYQTPRRVTVSTRHATTSTPAPACCGLSVGGDLLREVRAVERQRVINEVLDALEGVSHGEVGWNGKVRDRRPAEMVAAMREAVKVAATRAAVKELQEDYR